MGWYTLRKVQSSLIPFQLSSVRIIWNTKKGKSKILFENIFVFLTFMSDCALCIRQHPKMVYSLILWWGRSLRTFIFSFCMEDHYFVLSVTIYKRKKKNLENKKQELQSSLQPAAGHCLFCKKYIQKAFEINIPYSCFECPIMPREHKVDYKHDRTLNLLTSLTCT